MVAWQGLYSIYYPGRHLACATQNLKLESLDIAATRKTDIGTLLTSQPTLRSLRLPNKHTSFNDLLPSDLPCLRSVAGGMSVVMKLVPNRPVEDVEIVPSGFNLTDRLFMDSCASLFERLGQSTRLIKRLALRAGIFTRGKNWFLEDTFHKVIDLGDSILRGLEEFEIQTESLQMPRVRSSFGLSIRV